MKTTSRWLLCAGASLQILNATAGPITRIAGEMNLRSSAIDDSFQQSRAFGMGVNFNAAHQLDDSLHASFNAGLVLESGSSQSFFTEEYKPQKGLSLYEAAVEWSAFTGAALKLGAINQDFHDSPLLLGKTAFPGLSQTWKHQFGRLRFQLFAEQAIPTTETSSNLPVAADASPFYDIERAQATIAFEKMELELRGSHFAFHNLPGNVANESRFRGNSVAGVGDNGARFLYAFEGIESAARLSWKAPAGIDAALGGDLLLNLRAPSGQNRGMRLFAEAAVPVSRKTLLVPRVFLFRNESDAAPGFYNSSALAHNNRQGFGIGARAELGALEIDGQLIKANVIESTPFQSDFTGFFLSLRKSYELL